MKKKKIITISLICVFAVCTVFTGMMAYWQWDDGQQSKQDFDALAELVPQDCTVDSEKTDEAESETDEVADEADAAFQRFQELYELNHDFIGWITIEDTTINYPVMQLIDNPNYYLKHSFEKTYSDYGVPYVDEDCAVGLSTNTIIYGHHMKNGTMFSSLVNYADKSYFEEHPVISFDTIYGSGDYQIIAVFAFDTNNEDFRYNEYTDMTEAEFNGFIIECIERSAYDTGFTAEYGDKLLTLSTCEYTHTNGRFVVVAKLITE